MSMPSYKTTHMSHTKGCQLDKKEIADDMSWIHSLFSPGGQSNIRNLSAQWDN
jgi:hypothetical protein